MSDEKCLEMMLCSDEDSRIAYRRTLCTVVPECMAPVDNV